jgi:hypothetical protein
MVDGGPYWGSILGVNFRRETRRGQVNYLDDPSVAGESCRSPFLGAESFLSSAAGGKARLPYVLTHY